jgi:hypothetical protein
VGGVVLCVVLCLSVVLCLIELVKNEQKKQTQVYEYQSDCVLAISPSLPFLST